MKYTAKQFKEMTGHKPSQDDLERLNCDQEGDLGHFHCGYCEEHSKPRFVCGCWVSEGIVHRSPS